MLMPDDRSQEAEREDASAAPAGLEDGWWTRARLRVLYAFLRLLGRGDRRR